LVIGRDGKVLAYRQTATLASEGAAAVFGRIAAEIRAISKTGVAGIGIGSAGLIADGNVVLATNLNWESVPLAREVSRRVDGLPTFVENDANANVLGEGYCGSAVGCLHYVPPPQAVPPLKVATLASPAVGAATLVWQNRRKD
jgi:predicted NBD/HSP70 family sugar kinase